MPQPDGLGHRHVRKNEGNQWTIKTTPNESREPKWNDSCSKTNAWRTRYSASRTPEQNDWRGRLPNDDEVHQWFEGIDRKLEHEAADREVLLFNHGAMTTVLPKSTERYQPDLQVRYQEILTTCNKAYADADYKYWIGRFQQAGL